LTFRNPEQIVESRLSVERLSDVQVAGRHAESADHLQRCEVRPRDVLAALWYQTVERLVELECVPQAQAKEHVAETSRTFDSHRLQPHLLDIRELVFARLEQARVHPPARQLVRIRLRTTPALRIQLAKARHDFLPHLAADAHGTHQQPVGVCALPFFWMRLWRRNTCDQHASFSRTHAARSTQLVGTTRTFEGVTRAVAGLAGRRLSKVVFNCGTWASCASPCARI
jgi:hypothetical protein